MKLPDRIFGRDTGESYKRVIAMPDTKPPTRPPTGIVSAVFALEDQVEHWSVHGIPYRQGVYRVDLLKTLLDNGQAKTQDQWSEHARQALQTNQFHVADFPLYHALFTSLYNNKEQPRHKELIAQVAAFVKKVMFEKYLMTLSRARYDPAGNDTVIHNVGLPDQYEVQTSLVGPDEWIKNTAQPAPYQALTGAANTQEIQQVYHWLTDKDAYLFRVNGTPKQVDERLVGFNANSGGFILNCYRDLLNSDAALGVRLQSAAGVAQN